MFGLFSSEKKNLTLLDLDGRTLNDGDSVESLRYNLGECVLQRTEDGWEYQSLSTGEKVSWLRMIDASTERQKVRLKKGEAG